MRSVVKHSYIKGAKGKARAKAHVNYIQYRSGEDREKGKREFFNADRDGIDGREIKDHIDQETGRGVTVHKLILSPGVNSVELDKYTRETMDELGRSKGLDLQWYAVEHTNTDHNHVHVVLLGKDAQGRQVRLDRKDHDKMREVGDRYLEREHKLDRFMDRELSLLLKHGERSRDPEYKPDRGDRHFDQLIYGESYRKKDRGDKAERDRRDWDELDKDLHKRGGKGRGLERRKGRTQRMYEARGRLSDAHDHYQKRQAQQYWKQVAERRPDLAEAAQRELATLNKFEQNSGLEQRVRNDGIDRLLGQGMDRGRDQPDRAETQRTDRGDQGKTRDDESGRSRGDR